MAKWWVLVGALVVGVVLIIIFLVPFFLNADSFRPTIETQLSDGLGRTVTMGKLSFSLVQRILTAEDAVIGDDPEFSNVPFLQAKKLDVGVEIIPFLMHREVRITGLTIDTPSVQLIEHTNGKWNYSSLGSTTSQSASASSEQAGSIANLSIGRLQVVNGSALVSSIPQTAKPFEYSDVNLTVKQFSFLKSFPFELSAKLPGNGTLNLTGDAGPITQNDTAQTPLHAKLQLREFDPVAAGVIDKSKGISMVDDVDADVSSDSVTVSCTGKVRASRLQLVLKGSPAQEPVDIDFSISRNLASREGNVSDVAIHTGSVAVHVKGGVKFSPEAMLLDLHLSSPALPVEQLERLLPTIGIYLPSGSSLQGGTLTANIAITGPATAATLTGPVEIDNTRLAGFDLGSKIEGIGPLAGTSQGTDIQVLKASVNSSPQGSRISEIYGELPQIGTASGNGTVAPSGEIDFHLTAKLNNRNAKPDSLVNRSIPLTISGTAASPSIQAGAGASFR